ncbi:MAG: hypothetical protein QM820_64550 [Minicystis sp.]
MASALMGLLSAGVAPATASAQTRTNVYFVGSGGQGLIGRVYQPNLSGAPAGYKPPGMVLMHGCSGMWSYNTPPTVTCSGGSCTVSTSEVAQSHIEKWGRKLSAAGYVALAVDSYTTRTPTGPGPGPYPTPAQYQHQCHGDTYAGAVDPYTTRVDDFLSAKSRLSSTYNVNVHGVGELGWSQGAEATLVSAAATPVNNNTEWCDISSMQCVGRTLTQPTASVVFYPGCGPNLGYGYDDDDPLNIDPGYWRPDVPMRWNHGEADGTTPFAPCDLRVDEAVSTYGASIDFDHYASVDHSFDMYVSGEDPSIYAFPTAKCSPADTVTYPSKCARWDADIDSLAFIQSNVQGYTP